VTKNDIILHGGGGLLQRYKNSIYHFLKAVYPDYLWLPWKFNRVPRAAFGDSEV